ncbi:MAG: translation initiation factor IF-2 [Candidatus Coatesbacteria bacterium]|nr:MAG: translation initiation factor IF-2 [Candidatus Coatesbacteria bacterium]
MKVRELAKELGITIKELVDELKKLGISVSSGADKLTREQVEEYLNTKEDTGDVEEKAEMRVSGPKLKKVGREEKEKKFKKIEEKHIKEKRIDEKLKEEKREVKKDKRVEEAEKRLGIYNKPETKERVSKKKIEERKLEDKKVTTSTKTRRIAKIKRRRKLKKEEKEISKTRLKKMRAKEERVGKSVVVRGGLLLFELADLFKVEPEDLMDTYKKMTGETIDINSYLDRDIIEVLGEGFGYEIIYDEGEPVGRPPVVAMLGHVDHGKTTLLDAIRKTDYVSKEYGGITQHIGASVIDIKGKRIVFIDTPGHEAFTAMRARGAQITDIVVLVVAADDGVMPQTIEAYNHAKFAGVEIIVVINKIDKPGVNIEGVKRQLGELGLVPEEWGGDTLFSEVSALKGINIDDLLEKIILQAEMLELEGYPDKRTRGVVIESRLDKSMGPLATVIVVDGTLRVGDSVLVGDYTGKIRAMIEPLGERLTEALPGTPVEIIGLSGIPDPGDYLYGMDETLAKELSKILLDKKKKEEVASKRPSLDEWFELMKKGGPKELPLILKCDTFGTAEAIKKSIEQIKVGDYTANVLHWGVGSISESDVMLSLTSNAVIIGFNVGIEPKAKKEIEKENIDVRLYSVIYDVLDDIKDALTGLLEPEEREEMFGRAEVREVFSVSKLGAVAGCSVIEGKMVRGSNVRILRDEAVIYEGNLSSLKRFKDNVKEVQQGFECGIGVDGFNDYEVGDIIESFHIVREKRRRA